jgi:hypothetical protein
LGRTGTSLLAAAVAVLAAAALVDAVVGGRSGGDPGPPAPPPEQRETGAGGDDFLDDERVVGRVLYVDEACRVRALDLPEARRRTTPDRRACEFTSSPGGVLGFDGVVVAPEGRYAAVCRSDRVALLASRGGGGDADPVEGSLLASWPGCAPAWRPRGSLTLVRDGEVVDVGVPGAVAEPRVVLSRADLARAFAGPPWHLRDARAREIAWLDETRLAAVVRDGDGGDDLLALFREGRVVGTTPSPYSALSGLRASPRGSYVAARIGDASALVLLDREGEFVPTPLRGHAITWSQDELWTAVAAREAIYVFATEGRANRFARIPIAARDVFWR